MNFPRIEEVKIEKLYGFISKDLVFPDENVSVLIGDNGFGKSTIFRLLNAIFSFPDSDFEEQLSFIRNEARDLVLDPIYETLSVVVKCRDGKKATLTFFQCDQNDLSKPRHEDSGKRSARSLSHNFFPINVRFQKEGVPSETVFYTEGSVGTRAFFSRGPLAGLKAACHNPTALCEVSGLKALSYAKNQLSESGKTPIRSSLVQTERVVNLDYDKLVREIILMGLNHSSVGDGEKTRILSGLGSAQGAEEACELSEMLHSKSVFPVSFSLDSIRLGGSPLDEKRMRYLLFSKGPFFLKNIHDLTRFSESIGLFRRARFYDYVADRMDKSEWSICLSHPDEVQDFMRGGYADKEVSSDGLFYDLTSFFAFVGGQKGLPKIDPLHTEISKKNDDFENECNSIESFIELLWSFRQLKYVFDNVFQNSESRFSLVYTSDEKIAVEKVGAKGSRENGLNCLSSGQFNAFKLFYEVLIGRFRGEIPSSVVFLDEPEVSLHIAWQKQIVPQLKYIADVLGIQIVIATQSPFVLDGDNSLLVGEKNDG
jgi:predicted ATPase